MINLEKKQNQWASNNIQPNWNPVLFKKKIIHYVVEK